MNKKRSLGLDPLQREAVAWVQKFASGQAKPEDAELLKQWVGQSPAHAAAMAEASRTWRDIATSGRDLRQHQEAMSVSLTDLRRQREGFERRAFLGGLAAASAGGAVYAVVRPPFGLWPSWAELHADYRTGTGQQQSVMFAGDVAIRLNTQTSLAVRPPVEGADRIELIAGEASFLRSSGTHRSLVVLAGDGRIVAGASRFDVRHIAGDTDAVCVTCYDGAVRVEQRDKAVVLGLGQQVRYGGGGLGPIATINADIISAWQRGIVIFHGTPLADVITEINRYRPGKIILLNHELGRQPVSGRFRIDQMGEILMRLERAFDARLRDLPGGIVLVT
jgi:transmembrane sensor